MDTIRGITDEKGNDCGTVLLLGRVKCCRAVLLSSSVMERTRGWAASQ